MYKITKCILIYSFLIAFNVYSQYLTENQVQKINQKCLKNNQSQFEFARSHGFIDVTKELLLEKCIKNYKEVSFFKSYNQINNINELYYNTILKLENRISYLESINCFGDSELTRQYYCFQLQLGSVQLARNGGKRFLKRALITVNNLLVNDCINPVQ
ncbi:hypothetical protein [Silvanigrella aquatica]|uniref:Uncharacterized protein n=1 Tax=Silvanigrella aquatica TaxID=1915309 RepID=A0A1L4CXA7_9BACT|nr:hypothetical protein [Silvanigrella aquatica]APJ02582.1 hypothetical protein AXG55_00985 [Silvanigrella aquatica]